MDIAQEKWFLVAPQVGAPISNLFCVRIRNGFNPKLGDLLIPTQDGNFVNAGTLSRKAAGTLFVAQVEVRALGLKIKMQRYVNMLTLIALSGRMFQQNVLRDECCTVMIPASKSGLIWLVTSSCGFATDPTSTTLIAPYDRNALAKTRPQMNWDIPRELTPIKAPDGVRYTLRKQFGDTEYIAGMLDPTPSELLSGLHMLAREEDGPRHGLNSVKYMMEEAFYLGREWAMCKPTTGRRRRD